MTVDNIPQVEQVSKEEPVSEKAEAPVVERQKEVSTEQKPQPLSDEVKRAIAQEVEVVKRTLQSEKDRAIAEINREAERKSRLAESRAAAYEAALKTGDESLREIAEQARLKGDTQYYREYYQQEEQRRQAEQQKQQFMSSLRDEVSALGLNPDDASIDYAGDAPNYFDGRKRFTGSLTKLLQAKEAEKDKQLQDKWNELEAEFRKKHGLDSQDTTAGAGVVNQSEADFMAAWGNYAIPDTPENRKRYEEIQAKYY